MSWLLSIWQGHRYAVVVLLAFLGGGLLAFLLDGPAPAAGGLTKKQARAVATTRDSAHRAALLDTARAYRADTSARRSYAAGQRAQSQAIRLHTQSHVPVRPAADSTATRLQRILAAY